MGNSLCFQLDDARGTLIQVVRTYVSPFRAKPISQVGLVMVPPALVKVTVAPPSHICEIESSGTCTSATAYRMPIGSFSGVNPFTIRSPRF